MKKIILVGTGIFILGFIVSGFCGNLFSSGDVEHSYLNGIIFSILYLSSVIGISTTLILKEIKTTRNSNVFDFDLTSTLDTLKENDILNDSEYIQSLNYFNLVDKRNENKKKFDECVKILFKLSHENNMSFYEYKIKLLKSLYKQY
ncbi:hypothetical protein [Clostridium estertheticum]|uniref:Uncharacterized protein n=1 Tax=Clostridium estertheticum TaxID=238834 RepID=A0A7Y3T046_9CLOT|nr:hypothetical protein [Clostridium estertheticum]NNU78579.1 hypothetical protein [Clostridium estertheticum]WBL49669.1 hypothetical protein LOR37_23210 [Clostridium estertheticum]